MASRPPPAGPPNTAPAYPVRDVLQPALANALLKYHTMPRARLVAQTELGLASAGILGPALGTRDGNQITLSSCITLTAHARDLLPAELGGPAHRQSITGGFAASSPRTPTPSSRSPASPLDTASLASALAQASESTRDAAEAVAAAAAARERLASLRPRPRRTEPSSHGTEAPSEDDTAAAAALAAATAEAAALTRAAAAAEAQAAEDVASVASSLHPASPTWSAPHPVAPAPEADPTREQQNLVASVTALAHSTDAVALLNSFRKRYPNIHRAFLARAGSRGRIPNLDIAAFPPTILVPAVHAARAQEHGLLTLRASSSAGAALAGAHGAAAAARLDALFDYSAAQAIQHGTVGLEFAPLDACLGVLPLTQLALHFWYRDHSYVAPPESPLIAAASRIKFARAGVLDPGAALAEFLPLWGAALGADDDIPSALVYYHLSRALLTDAEPTGSATAVTISGALTTWTTFALDTVAEYDSRTRGSLDGCDIRPHTQAVEGFRAWALAHASAVKRAVAEVGHERVSIGHIVAVLTCKLDPAGDPRAPGILNKFRVAIADRTDATSGVPTFSSCVDDVTNRIIPAVAPAVRATQTTIDVGGAYYHGTPDSVEAGGRYLFARIPPWLSDLFPDAYPATDALGRHNFLRILGNMPGRCDAGRIWQRRFDVFLRGYGLTQLMTDRRTWVRTTDEGTLIVHDHVDDSRLTSTTDAVRDAFHRAWAETFGEPLGATPQSEDFTGLRHHRIDARTTAVSCEGIILRLQRELEPFPLSTNESCNWPLTALAFTRLRAQPAPIAERANTEHLRTAATLLGIIGFITALVRADGYFAYAVLCRFATPDRLSPLAFRCIIRLGHYLVATRRLALHLTAPAPSSHSDGAPGLDLYDTYADASNGDWDSGSGFAGFVLTTRRDADQPPLSYGGGALAWRAHAVRAGDDSSGAAELRSAATAYKYTLSARLLQAELRVDIAPTRPTKFYLDATSVLDGFDCERLTKNTRWMAMRYAMLRWGTACKSIEPTKLPSADNPADAFTKCLTGPRFVRARAFLLGYPLGDPPPVPQGTAPAPLA